MQCPSFYVLLPVFRPVDSYFVDQIKSIANQTSAARKVVFVISDLESGNLVTRVANENNIDFVLLFPDNKLNSFDAFEFGLRHILDNRNDEHKFFIALSDQDDIWEPEKLEILGKVLQHGDADLVHSDAMIVDHTNHLISHSMFRLENRVRRPGLRGLLYRNNITGMTCAFTVELAADSLPFPRQNGLLFHHDLWLGLVASIRGGIAFVDKPLVRYRQHENNAVGAIMSKRARSGGTWREWLLQKTNSFYLANYLAKMLYLRAMQMDAADIQINRHELSRLQPHLAAFGVGFRFVGDAVRLLISGRPQHARIALSFSMVRSARLAWALLQVRNVDFPARTAEFDRRRFQVVPGIQPGFLKGHNPAAVKESRKWTEFVDARRTARWKPDFDAGAEPAICVLVPTLNPTEMFAGIATAIDFGIGLAKHGHRVRLIAGDLPVISEEASVNFVQSRIKGAERGERITIHCGVTSSTIPAHKKDIFFATAWWTAHVAKAMIDTHNYDQKRFIYLVQDFEPNFYPWGDDFSGAMSSYYFDYIPVFNTTLLRDYFYQNFKRKTDFSDIAFHPSVELTAYTSLSRPSAGHLRTLAVYGRPEVARNMFPTCIAALSRFIIRHELDPLTLECVSIGMSHTEVELPNGLALRSVGKVPWAEYPKFLSKIDIGLALMYSPHPSHLPLEMAAAGVRIVTNRFANKDLSQLSRSIYSADPDPEALDSALSKAWLDLRKGPPTSRERNLKLDQLGKPIGRAIDELSLRILSERNG